MNTDEIKQQVESAFSKGLFLFIHEYVSSNGNVYDYTVRALEPGGYEDLVMESAQLLGQGKVRNPGDFDQATWDAACGEKLASYRKTLAGAQPTKNYSQELENHKYYATSPDKPGTVIIRNLVSESMDLIDEVAKRPNSAPKTLAKKAIDKQLPIGHFVGQLNLHPDRLDSVLVMR